MSNMTVRGRYYLHGSGTLTAQVITRTNEFLTRFGDMMDACGAAGSVLTRTADTGQYTPGAYTTDNTKLGYFVYKWSAHSVDLYVKFTFKRENRTPLLSVEIGEGTDGSGAITGGSISIPYVVTFTPSDDSSVSSYLENNPINGYCSVSGNHIFFLVGRQSTTNSENTGAGFVISRPLLVDGSGVDTGSIVVRGFSEYPRIGSSLPVLNVYSVSGWYTIFSSTRGIISWEGSYQYTIPGKTIYSLPGANMPSKGKQVFGVKNYVPNLTGHALDPNVVVVPFIPTANGVIEDIIESGGKKYLRTGMFGAPLNSKNSGSCLAVLWEE